MKWHGFGITLSYWINPPLSPYNEKRICVTDGSLIYPYLFYEDGTLVLLDSLLGHSIANILLLVLLCHYVVEATCGSPLRVCYSVLLIVYLFEHDVDPIIVVSKHIWFKFFRNSRIHNKYGIVGRDYWRKVLESEWNKRWNFSNKHSTK